MATTHQAGLWDGIKRLWKKWTGEREYTGPTKTEDGVVDALAEDFVEQVLWPFSPTVLRQLVIFANKAGLRQEYLPYLFFVWNRSRRSWPDMPDGRRAWLKIAKDLVVSQGDMPNYQDGSGVIPPVEEEKKVDQALQGFGFWLSTKGRAALLRGYLAKLKKWTPAMARAAGPDLPPDKALIYLRSIFETHLKRAPMQFLDGYYLEPVIRLLFQ